MNGDNIHVEFTFTMNVVLSMFDTWLEFGEQLKSYLFISYWNCSLHIADMNYHSRG